MYATFASATLIVLGVLLTVLGVFAAGNVSYLLIGLGAIAVGGFLGVLERRVNR
jgi:hypothetical protein